VTRPGEIDRSSVGPPRAGPALVILILALTTAACGEDAPGPPDAPVDSVQGALPFPVPASVSGDLILGDGGLAFHRCGADSPDPIRDRTGGDAARLVEELGYGSDRILAAVVLDGDALVEVRYAVPEGPGCEGLLLEGDLVARGNEPFWSLRVEGEEARWITPNDMEGAVHSPARWEGASPGSEGQGAAAGWTLAAPAIPGWDEEGPGGPLTLHLTPERCVDTMSGARFPFTARVERDGMEWRGCAVEGRDAAAQGNR
jgi:uncharacterized membrane protein